MPSQSVAQGRVTISIRETLLEISLWIVPEQHSLGTAEPRVSVGLRGSTSIPRVAFNSDDGKS